MAHVMATDDIIMTGDKELIAFLHQLLPQLERRVLRQMLSAGAQSLVKEIRSQAKMKLAGSLRPEGAALPSSLGGPPRRTKTGIAKPLVKTIGKRAWSRRSKGILGQAVGPKYPEGAHGHLVEFGHEIVTRGHKRTGRRTRALRFQQAATLVAEPGIRAAQAKKMRAAIAKLHAKHVTGV